MNGPDLPPLHGAPKLGRRLVAAALQAAGIALLLVGLLMSAYAYLSLYDDLLEGLQVQARVTAHNSTAAILFSDTDAASETLQSLRAAPVLVCALLTDNAGAVVANYRSGDPSSRLPGACAPRSGSGPQFWTRERLLHVSEPVMQDSRVIGRIVLGATMVPLYRRVLTYVLVAALAASLAMGLAHLRVLRVRRDMDAAENRLAELVYIDPLSGLRNRRAANQTIAALEKSPPPEGFVLAILDLDDFKMVNDNLGHLAGDALLRALSERLLAELSPPAMVYRYGGDEFLIGISPCAADQKAHWGERIRACLQEPFAVGEHSVTVRASIGLAHCQTDAPDGTELLRAADTAMYRAKGAGKNAFACFDSAMDQALRRGLRLQSELQHAISDNELSLHYQPIVSLADGRVVGVEALVRWQHPELGPVGPLEFIAAAERNGLILELGQWVLDTACRQMSDWRRQGFESLHVSVNVSGKQLGRGLYQQVRTALAGSGLPAHALHIELTEYSLVEALDTNVAQLAGLRALGVEVAIDDFGTGLSSLAYLRRLPIDILKIDRVFVKDLPCSSDDAAITSAIVSLARNLGLAMVAEGIETAAQCEWLRAAGCEFGQGYYFSRPLPAAALEPLLAQCAPTGHSAPRVPWQRAVVTSG